MQYCVALYLMLCPVDLWITGSHDLGILISTSHVVVYATVCTTCSVVLHGVELHHLMYYYMHAPTE